MNCYCSFIKVSDLLQLHDRMDTQAWTLSGWYNPEEFISAWLRSWEPAQQLDGGIYFIVCRVRAGLVFIGYRKPTLVGTHECVAYMWKGVEPLLLELLILKYRVPLHDGIPYAFKTTDKIKPNARDIPTRKDGSVKQMLST